MSKDSFHTVVSCPATDTIWDAMGEVWSIPVKESIVNTRGQWLFDLLVTLSKKERARVVMIVWRIWQMRNDMLHEKEPVQVEATEAFLQSYVLSLEKIRSETGNEVLTGKRSVSLRVH